MALYTPHTHRPAPAAVHDTHIGLGYWRDITERATESMEHQDDAGALGLDTLALREARALVQASVRGGPPEVFDSAVAALVESHHNLAELHRRMGEADEAEAHLCEAHESVSRLRADAALGAELQAAAHRQWQRTRRQLLMFVSTPGAPGRAQGLLQAALH